MVLPLWLIVIVYVCVDTWLPLRAAAEPLDLKESKNDDDDEYRHNEESLWLEDFEPVVQQVSRCR